MVGRCDRVNRNPLTDDVVHRPSRDFYWYHNLHGSKSNKEDFPMRYWIRKLRYLWLIVSYLLTLWAVEDSFDGINKHPPKWTLADAFINATVILITVGCTFLATKGFTRKYRNPR